MGIGEAEAKNSRKALSPSHLDLLSSVAYELKQPLITISGLANMLQSDDFSEVEVSEHHKRIELSSDRMLRILDGLLLASKVDQDQISLELEPANVGSIVLDVTDDMSSIGLRLGRTLRVVQTGRLQPAVINRAALRSSLFSMIDTVLHTSESEVIDILVHHQVDRIMVTMRDDGELISSQIINRTLSRLGRSSQPINELPGVSGMSVYITHVLSEAMEGDFKISFSGGKRVVSLAYPQSQQLELVHE